LRHGIVDRRWLPTMSRPKTGFTDPRRRFRVVSFTFRETVTRASKNMPEPSTADTSRKQEPSGPCDTSGEAQGENQVTLEAM
jgi:hypothetical protein